MMHTKILCRLLSVFCLYSFVYFSAAKIVHVLKKSDTVVQLQRKSVEQDSQQRVYEQCWSQDPALKPTEVLRIYAEAGTPIDDFVLRVPVRHHQPGLHLSAHVYIDGVDYDAVNRTVDCDQTCLEVIGETHNDPSALTAYVNTDQQLCFNDTVRALGRQYGWMIGEL